MMVGTVASTDGGWVGRRIFYQLPYVGWGNL